MRSRPKLCVFEGDVGYYRFTKDGAFCQKLQELGDLTVIPPEADDLAAVISRHEVLVSHHATPILREHKDVIGELAANPGRLNYVACTHGGAAPYAPLIEAGMTVTNWGDAAGQPIGVRSLTLLLALLHDLPAQSDHVRTGGWSLLNSDLMHVYGGESGGLRVGIYGLGAAGRAFVQMAAPLGMVLTGYDPYASVWPDGVQRAGSLKELFQDIHALVIMAGLTEATCCSVTAELLACLPAGGIVINAARGGILDQDALFAELLTGRLRAGLDVLGKGIKSEPDYLPPEHPVRQLPNCILTCHVGASNRLNPPLLNRAETNCLENISRFSNGAPLRWILTAEKLKQMT
ncbi:MAG: hypothetical protein NTV93_11160 [Verrucomicrobia bacterium]|nr:hypothetical protein [Verrucomicrobiota bacterium]